MKKASSEADRLKAAYEFFTANREKSVKLADIIAATGWKLGTVRNLFSKHWENTVLSKITPAAYCVIIPADMSFEQFLELHTLHLLGSN